MLDQNDLKILAGMFAASEERMMKRMDSMETRLDSIETRLDSIETRMDSIETRMDSIETQMGVIETRMDSMEKRISVVESNMTTMDKRINSLAVQMRKSEDLFMSELGKTQDFLERKIDAVQKDVNDMKEYYRIRRLEDDNTATLLKLYTGLREEVDELKEKIA